MVSDRRLSFIPILGFVALIALFFKMPEIKLCKSCSVNEPYMPLIGSAYFGTLIALSLLFSSFPSRLIARAGLIWASSLAIFLTYLSWPNWCLSCLIAHVCNILIWAIWSLIPLRNKNLLPLGVRWFLILFAPISTVALFSALNLTFMAYGFKPNVNISSLQVGEKVPKFSAKTAEGQTITSSNREKMVINFVAPGCPYCEEQLQILNGISNSSYRLINISPALLPQLIEFFPTADWVEDKENELRKQFKVHGFPSMYVVESDGKISKVIRGVPNFDDLKFK